MEQEFFGKKNIENFKKYQLDITFTDATAAMVEKEKVNTVDLKAKKIFYGLVSHYILQKPLAQHLEKNLSPSLKNL